MQVPISRQAIRLLPTGYCNAEQNGQLVWETEQHTIAQAAEEQDVHESFAVHLQQQHPHDVSTPSRSLQLYLQNGQQLADCAHMHVLSHETVTV